VFREPALPYELHALEPHLSARTMQTHLAKHQRYVAEVNSRVLDELGYPEPGTTMYDVMVQADQAGLHELFNAASQAWNHAFLWRCMSPNGGPKSANKKVLDLLFGSDSRHELNRVEHELRRTAEPMFGSGWVWLVLSRNNHFVVEASSNAERPWAESLEGGRSVLTIDLWEHAYYLDYPDRRAHYLDVFLDHLVHWPWVARMTLPKSAFGGGVWR
jgi:Fe-Mn family superoxide dismutase